MVAGALDDAEALREAYRSLNYAEMAEHFGCSKKTLSVRLRKFNINRSNTPKDSEAQATMKRQLRGYKAYLDGKGNPCTPECPGFDTCLDTVDQLCYFAQPEVVERIKKWMESG